MRKLLLSAALCSLASGALAQTIGGYVPPAGTGTVTSVSVGSIAGVTTSGAAVTSTGTITQTLNTQAAGSVLAAPSGASGTPAFRNLVASDITGVTAIANGGTGATTATTATAALQYLQGDTGSAARSLSLKLADRIDARDFGVVCDGVTNDTASINQMLTSETGKRIVFPAGTCLYNGGGVLGSGTLVAGAGRYGTTILSALASPTGGYLFNLSGSGAAIENVGFKANTTQTGGSYVALTGTDNYISHFYMDGDYNGITMSGSVSRILHGRFLNAASGATRIVASGGDNSQLIDDVLMGAQTTQVARAGIEVNNSSALIISNSSVLQQTINLLIDPGTGQLVTSLYVHDCFFDFAQNDNIKIAPTGSGNVVRSRFVGVWASESVSGNGVNINNAGTGIIQGMHFIDLHGMLNYGSGVSVAGSNVSDLSFIGGELAQNNFGFYVGSGTNLLIADAHIGAFGGMTGNTYGISISSGVTNFNLNNNFVTGNTTWAMNDISGNVAKNIVGNAGINPLGGSITVGASPFNYINTTGAPMLVFIYGGTVSRVAVAGYTFSAASNVEALVPNGQAINITYTTSPTMNYTGL